MLTTGGPHAACLRTPSVLLAAALATLLQCVHCASNATGAEHTTLQKGRDALRFEVSSSKAPPCCYLQAHATQQLLAGTGGWHGSSPRGRHRPRAVSSRCKAWLLRVCCIREITEIAAYLDLSNVSATTAGTTVLLECMCAHCM
jgi:hypothetical protein